MRPIGDEPRVSGGRPDDLCDERPFAEVFTDERPRLVGLAYRITGSVAEAEDVVQDAWLRADRAGLSTIQRPAAWLTTVTSRLALDRLRSAAHQRETYVGPWLPEPVAVDHDPAGQVELAESLTVGFLAVLERLGPTERVVFLLADVFSVPYDEIASVVDRSSEACRQVAARARRRVRQDRPRFAPTDDDAWQVTLAFLAASQAGDIDALVAMLADDAVLVSDGGADHHAARRPIVTPNRIARLLANVTARSSRDVAFEFREIGGQPGVVMRRDGVPFATASIDVIDKKVSRIWLMVNPAKLRSFDRLRVVE